VGALIAGPILGIVLTSQPAPKSIATAANTRMQEASSAEQVSRPVHANMYELRPRTPLPSPTPVLTPKPTPVPTPAPKAAQPIAVPPAASGDIVGIIRADAAKYGVSGDWMVSIAQCESGLRSNALNPRGPYYGLFQFLMSTFRANGGTNIWDPADQADVTARMLANGQAHQWACA
jgi:hypothetical protein